MRPGEEEDSQGPVIHDRRRIDPVTGQVRDPGRQARRGRLAGPRAGPAPAGQACGVQARRPGGRSRRGRARRGRDPSYPGAAPADAGAAPGAAGAEPGAPAAADPAIATRLAERTADLQRLQAEYANYRKRVERDRIAVREQALANVLAELLPTLDDIGRAREHGELVGGFKSVAESAESAVVKLGLTRYGEAGDPFDPTLHEALMHSYSADVTEPTCVRILQPGYKVGGRILRPALVAVAEPGDPGSEHTGGEDNYADNPHYPAGDGGNGRDTGGVN